ncbi:uncharacterized protein LOC116851616 isoform X2 [Odontomachus brunneus]|nr:uncharacterized protein LOC116850939 isoform X2 [Odontomachus brunneus]XP_032687105.1 uncharacterized protein LOC116851616 isoform X2 [Odontomachus brunneus]
MDVIGHPVSLHSSVCSKHFNESDFVYKTIGASIKRFLHDAAVPFAELCDVDKESSSKMNPDENAVNMVNDMQDTVGQTPTFTQVLDNTLSSLGVFENV